MVRRSEVVYRQHVRLQRLLAYVKPRSPFWRSVLATRAPALAELPILDAADEAKAFDDLNTVGLRRRDVEAVIRGVGPLRRGDVPLGAYAVRPNPGGLLVIDVRERALQLGALMARLLPSSLLGSGQDRVALLSRPPIALPRFVEWVTPQRLRCLGVPQRDPLSVQLARLRELAPTLIVGGSRRLLPVAERWGHEGPRRPVQRVVSLAETLSVDHASVLEAGFGIPHVDRLYRADEGLYGQTCAYGRLHLNEDLVIVERAWIDRKQGTYHPIVTDLFRTTLPRIRVRLADVLTDLPGPCPCGSPLRAVARIDRIDAQA
ncbi:MAG: hypothetical protein AAGA48_10970 [Myxococcota bacterium]